MELTATYGPYDLLFKQASGTSRGILNTKKSYFIKLTDGKKVGYGECGLLKGLSYDHLPDYEDKLQWACENIYLGIEHLWDSLQHYPSIQFGLEQAFISFNADAPFELFPSNFTRGSSQIPINGLVWMGDTEFMKSQIDKVLADGFGCVKMKIGAISWENEYALLKTLRKRYDLKDLEIRVDANGAYNLQQATTVMTQLAKLDIHSIEQPLAVTAKQDLAILCKTAAIPVALDESLIGCIGLDQKIDLLDLIMPQYIILKPSFIGGFKGSDQWISLAEKRAIGWWATSALESNVGLNAIAQWVFTKPIVMAQGLGTGSLYSNNIPAPLEINHGALAFNINGNWDTKLIDNICT